MAVESYKVGPQEAGLRLDLFLKAHGPAASRKQAKKLLDAGLVRVNRRKTIIASWELEAGDEVAVVSESSADTDIERYFLKVVYEDDQLIVVDKDAGIPCEESPQSLKPSLIQIINAYLRKNAPPDSRPYLGLIHRLDQETSGLMVYTKKKAANRISRQFKEHSIERRYQALVTGRIEKEQGLIKTGLAKEVKKGGAKVRVVPALRGKVAQTHYHVLERYGDATLVEVIPRTGRTHQIRVHLAHIGHPLIGDKLYGSGGRIRFKRHALHASILGFKHPISGKKLKFEAPLPKDMRKLVDKLRLKS